MLKILHCTAVDNKIIISERTVRQKAISNSKCLKLSDKLECGLMPNVMAILPNIGGALCSTLQSLAHAH